MPRHPRRLTDAGITPARYAELQYVCRQYPDYKRRIRNARAGITDPPARTSGAWKLPDPTGNRAAALVDATARDTERVRLIESCARDCAPPGLTRAILHSVTTGDNYENLHPPCGINYFYEARLLFFILLDARLP